MASSGGAETSQTCTLGGWWLEQAAVIQEDRPNGRVGVLMSTGRVGLKVVLEEG